MNERRTEGKGGKTVFPRGKVVEGWVNKRGDVRKLIYRHTEHRIPCFKAESLVFESPLSRCTGILAFRRAP